MSTGVSRKEKKVSETKELAQKAREVNSKLNRGRRKIPGRKKDFIKRCKDTW